MDIYIMRNQNNYFDVLKGISYLTRKDSHQGKLLSKFNKQPKPKCFSASQKLIHSFNHQFNDNIFQYCKNLKKKSNYITRTTICFDLSKEYKKLKNTLTSSKKKQYTLNKQSFMKIKTNSQKLKVQKFMKQNLTSFQKNKQKIIRSNTKLSQLLFNPEIQKQIPKLEIFKKKSFFAKQF